MTQSVRVMRSREEWANALFIVSTIMAFTTISTQLVFGFSWSGWLLVVLFAFCMIVAFAVRSRAPRYLLDEDGSELERPDRRNDPATEAAFTELVEHHFPNDLKN